MAQHLEKVCGGLLLTSQHLHLSPNPEIHEDDGFPIIEECITITILNLPRKKAPGIDHIRSEMLKPILEIIAPLLHYLFHICWLTTHTPSSWHVAQITPIYKKGAPDNPANFRPVSLTFVFRKILGYCIKPAIETYRPELDIAQGGFRPAHSTGFCVRFQASGFNIRASRWTMWFNCDFSCNNNNTFSIQDKDTISKRSMKDPLFGKDLYQLLFFIIL